jgi:hypothetical protein
MLATSYQQTPDADWAFILFGFSDTYGLLMWVMVMRRECMETAGNCRTKNKDKRCRIQQNRRKNADDGRYIQINILRPLKDIQITIKGSV